ncbi:MAG TPA: rhodanese-like domain-containing protein [Bacteroidales bacterium]|jgi:rhodanese-related sulfurtransferase|nr:rhodanese-like domain-containing protein [Bacteroidales bacterium]HOL99010.1 rhodanese-like domain-containing protein [Bacteroidales bacterium]HOM37355.1 rhodanese-like domain-containing protein [Bacteroidales bacterium]HPD24857.1 rhodanese-like domain-containing protein [Bacteroidales bacterium]HRS99263.1 rhodanese-like domain-containing protein [Bacteroidales bacterium]
MLNEILKKVFNSGLVNSLSPTDAYNFCLQGLIIVDIRHPSLVSYKKFDVPNVIYIPIGEIENKFTELKAEHVYLIADSSGLNSKDVTFFLNNKGLKNVFNLSGGILDWERLGLPVLTEIKEMLSGSCTCQLKYRNLKNEDI